MDAFVNRRADIELLDSIWHKRGAQFTVVYGRRRVGKTALLNAFAGKGSLFHWIAYRATSKDLLQDFSTCIYPYLNDGRLSDSNFTYGTWKVALETIALSAGRKKKIGVIIDEFPYLVEADASLPSVLQAVWDSKLSNSNIFLSISGSRIGMMKDEVLGSKGPLYGRATGIIYLRPIDFANLREFFPSYGYVQLVQVFAVTGGVPKYFEFISDKMTVLRNIETAIKDKTTLLTAEADLLLNEEFRETRIYLSVLRSLGRGPLYVSALASACGIDAKVLSRYLDHLIELGFVERRVSVGEDFTKSRKGRYLISDPFLNFYFRFITPHMQEIERGLTDQTIKDIRMNFDSFVGKCAFEKICREWLLRQVDAGKLNFVPEAIGEYWDRDMQVDVVALSRREQMMLAGEAKWTNTKVGLYVVRALEAKAKSLVKRYDYYCQPVIFSRSGFSSEALEAASKRNVQLIELNEMFTSPSPTG